MEEDTKPSGCTVCEKMETHSQMHALWDVHARTYHMMEERGENERSVLCVILCCVRITRNRHGLKGGEGFN